MRGGSTTAVAVPSPPEEDGADTRFLKFYLAGHAFAVPLTLLEEVLRPLAIARVPLAPSCLLGLANLRGAVLPVLDVRASLNLPIAPSATARILVLSLGRPIGVLVDRVANVMDAESEVEVGAAEATAVDKTLLRSVVRDSRDLAFTLDFDALLAREFLVAAASNFNLSTEPNSTPEATASEAESEVLRLVCFCVAGQDYALPITVIQAIISMPEKVVSLPNAPPSVFGVLSLQNSLLPVFHLQDLLGLAPRPVDQHSRVIVVGVSVAGEVQRAGLIVDKVSEVLQISVASLHQVPPLLGQTHGTAEVSAICRAGSDERLFGVLSVQALLAGEQTQNLLRQVQAETLDQPSDAAAASEDEETQIVVLHLLDEIFGLAISDVEEIVRLSALAPVPKAPKFVLGVMNVRGAVVPVLSPRRALGWADTAPHSAQRILIVTLQGARTGVLVDGVSAVLPVAESAFEMTPPFLHPHAHLVQRVAHLDAQRMLLMLDLTRLLDEEALRALAHLQTTANKPL